MSIDGLRDAKVLTHIQINAGEIASKKDAKVNSIAKRFSDIKRRYNINIQTTSVGYTPPKAARGVKVEKKARGRPPNKSRVQAPTARDAAIKSLLEDDEIPSRRRPGAKGRLPAALPDESAWDESFASTE